MLLTATALFTLFCCTAIQTGAERGFILQAPRVFVRNTNSKAYLKLFDVQYRGKVTVKLLKKAGDDPYYTKTVDISQADAEKQIALDVKVPEHVGNAVRLHVSGEFETPDKYKFSGEDVVDIWRDHPRHIFIQTEKHIYRAGETVKFRVLVVDSKLKPFTNTNVTVTVTTPYGSEVGKWAQVLMKKGFEQFELPLASTPPYGKWFISASVLDIKEEIHFQVQDYAEMKFEVNIHPPSFVLQETETISVQICAQYIYGKQVEGKLTIKGSVGIASLGHSPSEILVDEKEIIGCGNYTFQMSVVDKEYLYHTGDLKLIVEVTEEVTGERVQATKVISRSPTAVHLEFKCHTDYFKPGLPYHGTIKVTYPDNTEAEEQRITVCSKAYHECSSQPKSKLCRNFTSDATGTVRFTIPPQAIEAVSILIEVMSAVYGAVPSSPKEPVHVEPISKRLRPWYSETHRHIQVHSVETNLRCNSRKKFQVLYTGEEKEEFQGYYEVINKGLVVGKGGINLSYKETDISTVWRDTILETEITDTGLVRKETVLQRTRQVRIASAHIELDLTTANFPVSHLLVYSFSANREVIADSFKFAVEDCLINDIKVNFVKSANKSAQISVAAPPNSLCGIQTMNKNASRLQHKLRFQKETVLHKIFNHEFGLFYPKSHCRNMSPGFSTHYYGDAIAAFESSGFLVISDYKLITRPCETNSAALGNCNFGDSFDNARNNGSGKNQLIDASDTLDETISSLTKTWLFDTVHVGESGSSVMEYPHSDSATELVGNAVCTNELGGIGFAQVNVTQGSSLYHMQITVPSTVAIGEKLPISVTLFTMSKKCLPLYVELHESTGYELVTESSKTGICVCDANEETYEFFVKAKTLGEWSIAVTATAATGSNVCDKKAVTTSFESQTVNSPLNVKAEGFPYKQSTSQMVCLKENDGEHKINTPLPIPPDVIKDSTVAYHSVSSNIMTGMMTKIKEILLVPPDYADWTSMEMACLVYSLDYLTATGTLTDELKAEAVGFLQKCYQFLLRFRKKNYAYAALLKGQEVYVYVTAVVVRTFSQASKYIHIDPADITKTRDWLLSIQKEDGCIYIKDYKYQLTAYVVPTLIISGMSPNHPVIRRAMACMETNKEPNVGQLAYYAYAFAMADDQAKAESYLNELMPKAITKDDMMYWNGSIYIDPYEEHGAVCFSSLVVLTMLKLGKPPNQCMPIIKFLNANAPAHWIHYSNADQVLGVEAFSKFAPYISYDDINVRIKVAGALNKELHFNKENRHLVKEDKMSSTANSLSHTLSGYGCVIIKTMIEYNTKTFPKKNFFDLSASASHSANCETASIQIKTRSLAKRDELLGMAVVRMAMISGYDPVKESIEKLVKDKKLGIERYEIKKGVVKLFFDKFETDLKVFDVQVKRSLVIKDAKPAAIKVYDYYSPGQDQQVLYSIEGCM